MGRYGLRAGPRRPGGGPPGPRSAPRERDHAARPPHALPAAREPPSLHPSVLRARHRGKLRAEAVGVPPCVACNLAERVLMTTLTHSFCTDLGLLMPHHGCS